MASSARNPWDVVRSARIYSPWRIMAGKKKKEAAVKQESRQDFSQRSPREWESREHARENHMGSGAREVQGQQA